MAFNISNISWCITLGENSLLIKDEREKNYKKSFWTLQMFIIMVHINITNKKWNDCKNVGKNNL